MLTSQLRRWPIRNNHTGTHILNYALREVLGDDVQQRGSLVAAEKLRFDFSHKAGLTTAELSEVERISTNYLRQNLEVFAQDVPLSIAREIEGVRAVFGETYPDPVRVVSVGVEVGDLLKNVKNPQWKKVSIEFCGGTHVQQTGDIKDLVILEENGIAAGIRRITAVTGEDAHAVQHAAKEYSQRLDALEKGAGANKDAEMKKIGAELKNASISKLAKSSLQARHEKIAKDELAKQKARQKEETKTAIDAITKYFADNTEAKVFVTKLPISASTKILSDVLKHVQTKAKDKAVYIFTDDTDGKIAHGCHVAVHIPSPSPPD